MQCAHCATPVPDDARFCHVCGSLVSDAEGQAAATAAMDDSAVRHMERLLTEDTEGEFKILRQIGRGGMAVVYLVREIHLDRNVAIKVLPPELAFGHGVERFKREARTAAALDHPNIIPVYRVASGGKIFWYAMKYLEGRSLEVYLKTQGQLELDATARILKPVAAALDYAHEHEVVHRDVKPANVMLDSRRRVTVTDFGIAKPLTEISLTASGSMVGTPYYMAPEQGMGKPVSGATDQYAVAVMAFHMLTGHVPFEGDSAIDILHKHCTAPVPPIDVLRPELPEHTCRAIQKGLAKKPEQRFTSVRAFVEALERPTAELTSAELSAQEDVTEVLPRPAPAERPAPTRPPRVVPRKRRRPVLFVVGLVAIVGASAGGWWWLTQRGAVPAVLEPPVLTPESPSPPSAGPVALAADTAEADTTEAATGPEQTGQERPAQAEPRRPIEAPPPAPTTGRITVTNLPSNGVVLLDGGRQNGTEFEIDAGRHVLRLEARGFESIIDTITVAAGERLVFPFLARAIPPKPARTPPPQAVQRPPATPPDTRPGILQVRIAPWANVLLNGVNVGAKSRFVDTLPSGQRQRLRFERDGYVPLDTTIVLEPGEERRMAIRLTPRSP